MATPTLERTTFRTSRLLDFVSRKELIAQTGHPEDQWPLVVLKELVDNALDACEGAGQLPTVKVTVDAEGIAVEDNGPGLPETTLDGVLDFSIRVSNREAYVSPTRGAQGNALKTLVAMPFVLSGEESGQVDVSSNGKLHRITLGVDQIRQEPTIRREEAVSSVTNGTVVRLHWPDSASSLLTDSKGRFLQIAFDYVVLNPHLTLTVDWFGEARTWKRTDLAWEKWKPNQPTSPHWYRVDHLERLIGAYLAHDADNGHVRMVRDLVAEFRGLSSTAKQKAIASVTGLGRASLTDFWDGEQLDHETIASLLEAMKLNSRPVKSADLGIIGRDHLAFRLAEQGCTPESFTYKKVEGDEDGVPWVLETAFGWLGEESDRPRRIVTGVNWSPGIVDPFRELGRGGQSLSGHLAQLRAGPKEPIIFVLHLAKPRVEYTDRGKSAVVIGGRDES
jgi:DNA topoisomerase VI subunit B